MSSIRQKWKGVVVACVLGGVLVGSPLVQAAPDDNERLQRWQSLPPEKREELMERYERFRQLPPEEQEAVKRRYHKWREMPEEDRRAMRDKWERMSPEERRALRERMRNRDDAGDERSKGKQDRNDTPENKVRKEKRNRDRSGRDR